jgi:hypothetical protein
MNNHNTQEKYYLSSESQKLIFCLVFSVASSIGYVISDLYKLPLFTYYPAVNEFAVGFTKMNDSQGPAMYWYGWILSASVFATVLALIASKISFSNKYINYLAHSLWLLVWLLIPVLIYSLNYYWTHA